MRRTALLLLLALPFAAAPASAQTCLPLPADLVSWWGAEGDAQDYLSGNHGALQNGAGFAAGMVGQAFSFDGSDDFVRVPDAANLDITGDLTIDAWVYPTAFGDQRVIVSKRSFDNQDANMVFFLESDGRLSFTSRSGGGGFATVTGATALALNQWSLVAVTVDAATLTLYINGAVDASVPYSAVRPANTGDLTIGIVSIDPLLIPPAGYAAGWSGLLDEVEIFSRALAGAEIAAIYGAGSGGKCPPATQNETSSWGRVKGIYR